MEDYQVLEIFNEVCCNEWTARSAVKVEAIEIDANDSKLVIFGASVAYEAFVFGFVVTDAIARLGFSDAQMVGPYSPFEPLVYLDGHF